MAVLMVVLQAVFCSHWSLFLCMLVSQLRICR